MIQVSAEELTKISQFIAGCNDMINGKFLLADIKITKMLNMLAGSQELYNYIKECMIDYDFSREYHRAEVKNRMNGGVFAVPATPNSLVAFVFCLFVECDAKRIDFYNFIKENFASESKNDSYKLFAETLLVPFAKAISSHFMLDGQDNGEAQNLENSIKKDLMSEPMFDAQNTAYNQNYFANSNNQNVQNSYNSFDNNNAYYQQNNNIQNVGVEQQNDIINQQDNTWQNEVYQQDFDVNNVQNYSDIHSQKNENISEISQQFNINKSDKIWHEICAICDNVISSVYTEKRLKDYLKEELIYILKTIKYSVKYKDIKIVSALVTAFDELSRKFRSIQFVFGELKNKIEELY